MYMLFLSVVWELIYNSLLLSKDLARFLKTRNPTESQDLQNDDIIATDVCAICCDHDKIAEDRFCMFHVS